MRAATAAPPAPAKASSRGRSGEIRCLVAVGAPLCAAMRIVDGPPGGTATPSAAALQKLAEFVFGDHFVSSIGVARRWSEGSAPSIRRASCRRDFTVPARRWIARAISLSDKPA